MKKLLIGLGILAVVVVIVIVSISRTKQSGESVYTADVSKGDVITLVTGTGVVQARTKVNISSEIYGQIVELPVKEGENVAKGDLLVRIDPEKYRSDVDRLAANVRMSRIAIEQQDVNLRNLERERQRAHELHAEGLLPDSDLEKADLAVEGAAINLKSLRESVTLADASLSRVQTDLTKTRIFAPMSGRVTQVNTEVGEQVIVGTTNIPGSVLMVISDMSEVLAEISVDETEVVRLKSGADGEAHGGRGREDDLRGEGPRDPEHRAEGGGCQRVRREDPPDRPRRAPPPGDDREGQDRGRAAGGRGAHPDPGRDGPRAEEARGGPQGGG